MIVLNLMRSETYILSRKGTLCLLLMLGSLKTIVLNTIFVWIVDLFSFAVPMRCFTTSTLATALGDKIGLPIVRHDNTSSFLQAILCLHLHRNNAPDCVL